MKSISPYAAKRRRCIFVDDAMWRAVSESAKRKDRTAASWVRQAIRAALGVDRPRDNDRP